MILFYILKKYYNRSLFLIVIPLILSSFTHLWNPIGFPAIWVVEGQYMQRAMSVLDGLKLEESKDINPRPYDHPFFAQTFLAGILAVIGYPELFIMNMASTDADKTVQVLYFVPRILMGLLAVADTFLVYKIAERCYNKNIAFIAAVLFALTPTTWILRKILLESILLPFLLLSVLFALYSKYDYSKLSSVNTTILNNVKKQDLILITISGIFLGLSILTKVPALTMIPLVGYLICIRKSGRADKENHKVEVRKLGVWLIPVILVPLIWPIYSVLTNNFDLWLRDLSWNTAREHVTNNTAVGNSLVNSLTYIFQ